MIPPFQPILSGKPIGQVSRSQSAPDLCKKELAGKLLSTISNPQSVLSCSENLESEQVCQEWDQERGCWMPLASPCTIKVSCFSENLPSLHSTINSSDLSGVIASDRLPPRGDVARVGVPLLSTKPDASKVGDPIDQLVEKISEWLDLNPLSVNETWNVNLTYHKKSEPEENPCRISRDVGEGKNKSTRSTYQASHLGGMMSVQQTVDPLGRFAPTTILSILKREAGPGPLRPQSSPSPVIKTRKSV